MFRYLFSAILLSLVLQAPAEQVEPIAPIKAPFAMPQLQRPAIPQHAVSIRDHGGVEGGIEKNTGAFKKAIAACSEQGGGRVIVPAGKWLTGPIHLKSNIELRLEKGAEVIFSDIPEDYLPPVFVRNGGVEIYNYSPLIYARDCENVAITGPGQLNGNAKAWWEWKKLETQESYKMGAAGVPVEKRIFGTREAAIRPSFIGLVNCRNVLLEGFTIGSGPNWTIHPIYCENVIIRRVNIDTHGPNNDGIDPDSCRNVLVEYCTFNTGDDCMVLKSGYNEDGRRVARPTENVVIRHCTGKEGHGGLVIGSEMSGDVRNVFMHDCEFDRTDHAVRVKSRLDRGGIVENVWVQNVRAKDMQRDVVILTTDYSTILEGVPNIKPPLFRNIFLKDITGDGAPAGVIINGLEASPIQSVHFENVTITAKKGVIAKNVSDLTFTNLRITTSEGSVYDLTNASGVTISNSTAAEGTAPFLRLQGKDSDKINIESSDLGKRKPFEVGDGAAETAITLKP
ncbi:MAG: hypothetical protein QOE70_5760 [Chthoniobacter sp.]|jgi:polygalacturonase|nr:hypothetical protein [Chthoniobacter sp.]